MSFRPSIWIPRGAVLLAGLWISAAFRPPARPNGFDLNQFGQLPVLNGGRLKPLDTIARTSLLALSGKQTLKTENGTLSAIEWLTDTLFRSKQSALYPVFEIDDPDVLGLLGIQQTQKRRFSFAEIASKSEDIERQGTQAEQVRPEQRTRFQTAVLNLQGQVLLYQKLRNTLESAGSEHVRQNLMTFAAHPLVSEVGRYIFVDRAAEFYPLPLYRNPGSERQWVSIGRGVLIRAQTGAPDYHPGILAYASLSDTWQNGDAGGFNKALEEYGGWLSKIVPKDVIRTRSEWVFNRVAPFYRSLVLYLWVILVILMSWLIGPTLWHRTGLYLLGAAFTVHTLGLITRILLQGRPPVTNLYSSAIFVGWVAVLMGILLERLYRNGMGSLSASFIGFITLIIAHHLASTGDTLEMMRAVLDSNFWLATHVVCITIGYGSTFLSGILATIYLFRRLYDPGWTADSAKTLERMVYGVVCFSLLFSFTGTILGGIWADQSWGRFWGWDPKENGALLIVLWNAFILHAKWGNQAEGKQLMRLAVGGNIVTAISWFGVNMLGIGLHSYGFMDKAFVWLLAYIASQGMIIWMGTWRSKRRQVRIPN